MQRHKPPSRIRYEKSHPTVSFRVKKEIKERLEKALERKSFAEFVKEALGEIEREKKSIKVARAEGYSEGYTDGFEKAKLTFLVATTCAVCGKRVVVNTRGEKETLDRLMREHNWCHAGCVEYLEEKL